MLFRLAISICALLAGPGCDSVVRDAIYHPPEAPLSLAGLPAGTEIVAVKTADGLTLSGIATPARGDRPILLLFHGNAASASSMLRWFAPLAEAGFGIVAAEYRGYSGNPGTPSQDGIAYDADAFLTLAETLARDRPVIVIGHSLGGGVAFDLSRRARLDALVTIGTFTSIEDMAPAWGRGLVPDSYDNLSAVRAADEPVFLIHGRRDSVVPFDHSERLARAATQAGLAGGRTTLATADHIPAAGDIAIVVEAVAARLAVQQDGDRPSAISAWQNFVD
ncbi:MAG: alpha/beta fold hydrolase [Pseudomonadota bacterium]